MDAHIGKAPVAAAFAGEEEVETANFIGGALPGDGEAGGSCCGKRTEGGEAPIGADPQETGFVKGQSTAEAAAASADGPFVNFVSAITAELTGIGIEPNRAVGIFASSAHLADVQVDHFAFFHEGDAGIFCADPEIGLAVLEKANDVAAFQAGRVVFVEDRKVHAVEAGEAFGRAAPEIAVTGLDDGADDALGQSAGFRQEMLDGEARAESGMGSQKDGCGGVNPTILHRWTRLHWGRS